uniref:Uncharacterized protein LOC104247636 n=1 Tax=Nicotiana sylvestris TaxID=4096 RepID=A0A1U7YT71_NICSY|nr:PREDICTED: uncharacterized protein LOC104247636 [Nicotiana sylvestris]
MSFLCSIIFIFGPRTFIAGRWGKEEETGEWGKHHKQEDWQADLEGDQIVCPSFLAHLEGVIRMNLEENSSQLNLEIRKLACRSRCLRGRVRAFQSFSNCRGFRDSGIYTPGSGIWLIRGSVIGV